MISVRGDSADALRRVVAQLDDVATALYHEEFIAAVALPDAHDGDDDDEEDDGEDEDD